MRTEHKYSLISILAVSLLILSCVPKEEVKKPVIEKTAPAGIIAVDDSNFGTEVQGYNGSVVLLFLNEDEWQSRDMRDRFEHFAGKYSGFVKFCEYPWSPGSDGEMYALEALPTVVLYRNGEEIDRIKGIPPEESAREKWNDDIELWLLKNTVRQKPGRASGDYKYLFKNGYKLHISGY